MLCRGFFISIIYVHVLFYEELFFVFHDSAYIVRPSESS